MSFTLPSLCLQAIQQQIDNLQARIRGKCEPARNSSRAWFSVCLMLSFCCVCVCVPIEGGVGSEEDIEPDVPGVTRKVKLMIDSFMVVLQASAGGRLVIQWNPS